MQEGAARDTGKAGPKQSAGLKGYAMQAAEDPYILKSIQDSVADKSSPGMTPEEFRHRFLND